MKWFKNIWSITDIRQTRTQEALSLSDLGLSVHEQPMHFQCIVVECYYGHASEHLAEFFSDFGFKDVYSLEGGYSTWKDKQQEKNQ